MLAELAAANAAYATISKFIANGKEISDALAPLKNLFGAEEELKARDNHKKDGLFSRVTVKSADDFDEFFLGSVTSLCFVFVAGQPARDSLASKNIAISSKKMTYF